MGWINKKEEENKLKHKSLGTASLNQKSMKSSFFGGKEKGKQNYHPNNLNSYLQKRCSVISIY